MANEKVFPKGVMAFKPHASAPSFVKGTIVITLDDFKEFVNGDGFNHLTEYNGKKQLKLQITESKDGGKYVISVDTYKKEAQSNQEPPLRKAAEEQNYPQNTGGTDDDLPF